MKMADVIVKWQDGTATLCMVLEDGKCYCQVTDGIATLYIVRRWQMLLPSGRWNNHLGRVMMLGRCYNQVGTWNSHRVYFVLGYFSSEVLYRTSSQMCGRWYLSIFLFRDGLLTIM